MNTPVLLIHFNRPSTTRRQLEALKTIAPKRVWLLCDGPRGNTQSDAGNVADVRLLLDRIPWECDVTKLYRDQNLGCFRNISEGITWFLNDCNAGIILEDDIIPDPSFFRYCDELLDRYANTSEIYAISGQHGCSRPLEIDADYGFTNYFDCWGWATWKRAWDDFDPDMIAWRDRAQWRGISRRVLHQYRARLYWDMIFKLVDGGQRDSWAYRYLLSIWKQGGSTVVPRLNLTKNVGFSEAATQTAHLIGREFQSNEQVFPLSHPDSHEVDSAIDRVYEDELCSKSPSARLRWLYHKLKRSYDRFVNSLVD
jgi:hypothetical protein